MSKSKNYDIKLRLLDYIPKGKFSMGVMRLVFEGEDFPSVFVNSIGRAISERIPTYAFPRSLVKFTKIDPETGYTNPYVYNFDMISEHVHQLPVSNIDPELDYLHERFWLDVDYLDDSREIHENEKRIEASLNIRNQNVSENLRVTTNDMDFYVDGVKTELYDKDYPFQIIDLRPKEELRLSMKAVLGIGMVESCWKAGRGTIDIETDINGDIDAENERIHEDIDVINFTDVPNHTILRVQGGSQFDEYKIVERALSYMVKRSEILKNEFIRIYLEQSEQTNIYEARIPHETYTMLNPIVYELNSLEDVIMAAGIKKDDLEKIITLRIETLEAEDITKVIEKAINNLISKIEYVEKLFQDIKKETYSTYLKKDGTPIDYEKRDHVFNTDKHAGKWLKSKSKSSKSTKSTKGKTTKTTKGKKGKK